MTAMRRAVVATALMAGLTGIAVPAVHAQVASPLSITSTSTDAAAGTLTIAGDGFGSRPFVTLDLVPLNIQLAMPQRILAVVPVDQIPPGSYLLTVTRGTETGDSASVEVRIGDAESASSTSASAAPGGAGPGASLSAASDVAARVGDRTITLADVDREWQRTDPVGFLIASRRLYDARRRIITDLVNNELLAREASARGLTVDALLKEELPKRTVPLPDNALSTLYQSLGTRARGASLEQMRPALREWLARKVEPDLAKMTYVEELTKVSTRADILLTPPRVEVLHAPDDPTLGPASAPVEVVMFGDFQQPAYARYAAAVPRVREMFGARVRFVFKHFPANDAASVTAAEAAACANLQGKFWEFHDRLLGEAGALDTARFKRVAAEVGADTGRFDACVDKEETMARIGTALEETRRYDVPGAGALLVNGRLAPEPPSFLPPFEYFKRLVEEELARQAKEASGPR